MTIVIRKPSSSTDTDEQFKGSKNGFALFLFQNSDLASKLLMYSGLGYYSCEPGFAFSKRLTIEGFQGSTSI